MKTAFEKELLKKLKRDHKNDEKLRKQEYQQFLQKEDTSKKVNKTGILPTEVLLEDTHEVNWDYLYIIDDDGGKVIRSDVKGNVSTLKRDLRSLGYVANNVYSCDIFARTT